MGCACPTDNKPILNSTGEEQVRLYETTLTFAKLPATKTAMEVLVFAQAGEMNSKQLRDFLKSLGMDFKCLYDEGAPKQRFFELFREGKKYNAKKITLLGVLLGSGSVIRKAEILFNLYKPDEEPTDLTASQVYQLVQDLCEVALIALPQYAKLELEYIEDTKELPKLVKFLQKLEESVPVGIDTLASALLGKGQTLSEVVFKTRLADTDAKVLCSSTELRTFVSRLSPKAPLLLSPREANTEVSEVRVGPDGRRITRVKYKLQRSASQESGRKKFEFNSET